MAGVRVLVGTKKGAFILTSDERREQWDVQGPLFSGWSIYHMKGSPVDHNRIYASQCSDWFGQVIQRSDDGGKTWAQPDGSAMPGHDRHATPESATSLSTKARPARTCGTTELSIRGNSNVCGISNLL